jgi:hypothetical protein
MSNGLHFTLRFKTGDVQWQLFNGNIFFQMNFVVFCCFAEAGPRKSQISFIFLDILFVVGWQNYDNNFQITIFQNRTMPRVFQTQVSPEVAHNESLLNDYVAKFFHLCAGNSKVIILKRSIDVKSN